MHIGTCGHEIDEGISCSIDESQIMSDGSPAVSYGTYCADCVLLYYYAGDLKNNDLNELIETVIKQRL